MIKNLLSCFMGAKNKKVSFRDQHSSLDVLVENKDKITLEKYNKSYERLEKNQYLGRANKKKEIKMTMALLEEINSRN